MAEWTTPLLVFALIAAVLGFSGVASSGLGASRTAYRMSGVARVLFAIFALLFLFTLFAGTIENV